LPEVPYEEDPLAAFKMDPGLCSVYVEQTDDGEITKIIMRKGEEVSEFMGPPEMREEIMKIILEGEREFLKSRAKNLKLEHHLQRRRQEDVHPARPQIV
jgi:hypothetical protein